MAKKLSWSLERAIPNHKPNSAAGDKTVFKGRSSSGN